MIGLGGIIFKDFLEGSWVESRTLNLSHLLSGESLGGGKQRGQIEIFSVEYT